MISGTGACAALLRHGDRAPRRWRAPASRRSPGRRCRAGSRGGRASGWPRGVRRARRCVSHDRCRAAPPRSADLGVAVRQELVQRRVQQADGDRQPRHDAEQLPRNPRAGTAAGGPAPRGGRPRCSARIICRTAPMRAGSKNMCSVRHRPMPSAPNLRAVSASSGVSALARTLSRRALSAHSISVPKSPDSAGSIIATVPMKTSPVAPSSVMVSPARTVWPPACSVWAP